MFRFLSALLLTALSCGAADTVVILPLVNINQGKASNLDWIGESVAETIHESLSSAGLLVLAREEREEAYRRLSLRPGVLLTKASVLKVGETLDAGRIIFGEFKVEGAEAGTSSLKSITRLTLHTIDLKKFREGPVLEQTGPLETLSHMEMELAWLLLRELAPARAPVEADFLRLRPAVRVDAMESYVRGLMAAAPEQKIKLFTQAARLDDHFSPPAFQLGRIYFDRKDYKTATAWLVKVTRADSHFMEASFLLGLCYYYNAGFDDAIRQFRLVAAEVPINEVFNNLGAALSRRNDPAALDNFKKALDGDSADPDYWFNLGYQLWKQGQFTQAADAFRAVLDRAANDQEATAMLGRSIRMDPPRAGDPKTEARQRIKTAFEDSAFRQLKAELQAK